MNIRKNRKVILIKTNYKNMKFDLLKYPFTEKQRNLIKWIEDTLGIKYDFSNLSDWINKWRPIAEQEDWERQLEYELEMEIIDARRDW